MIPLAPHGALHISWGRWGICQHSGVLRVGAIVASFVARSCGYVGYIH